MRPSLSSRLFRRACLAWYRLSGWRIAGRAPDAPKFVLVGAPHTSNWDFLIFLGATHDLGVAPSYMGKHSLFRWPLRRFMLDMGGIPVDRSGGRNAVDQVVEAFARADRMALVVAPEGTRKSDGHWRSGFYHIAMRAGVPIVPAWIDPARRVGQIGEPIVPTGDYRADLARLAAFFRAGNPDEPRFREIDRSLLPSP